MRRALEIALDAARGLAYLHHRCVLPRSHTPLRRCRSGRPAKRLCWPLLAACSFCKHRRCVPHLHTLPGPASPLVRATFNLHSKPPARRPVLSNAAVATPLAPCSKPNPIIHRDLKPGNLMLSGGQYQDQMQIVFDTGVVKLVRTQPGPGLAAGGESTRTRLQIRDRA